MMGKSTAKETKVGGKEGNDCGCACFIKPSGLRSAALRYALASMSA